MNVFVGIKNRIKTFRIQGSSNFYPNENWPISSYFLAF